MKIGFAATYVLTFTVLYSPDGSHKLVLYMDPSVKYFGSSHTIYALITLFLLFLVLVIPILFLFLYPFQLFQKCLHHFNLQLLPLRAFVDAFQGCYKNGTNGTRNCRYFAGLQLVLRLLFPFIFMFIRGITWCLCFSAVILGLYITLLVIVQPYTVSIYNKTEVALLMTLVFADFASYLFFITYNSLAIGIFITCVCVQLLYLVIWSAIHIKHIITHRTWCRKHSQETGQLLSHIE